MDEIMIAGFNETPPQPIGRDGGISCCSKYRECSAAGQCVNSHLDYSANCQYRANLKQGKVFYGKNADDFHMSEYRRYLDIIHALGEEERTEFHRLLNYMLMHRRGENITLLYASDILSRLERVGLITCHKCAQYVMPLMLDGYIKELLKKDIKLFSRWATREEEIKQQIKSQHEEAKKVNSKAKKPPFVFKKEFIPWVSTNGPQFVAAIEAQYTRVSMPDIWRRYAEEYYHDNSLWDVQGTRLCSPLDDNSVFIKKEDS